MCPSVLLGREVCKVIMLAEMDERFTVVKGYYRKNKVYVGAHIRKLHVKRKDRTTNE